MRTSDDTGTAAPATDSPTKPLGDVIAINEGLIKRHLNKVVVTTVEEALNALLHSEVDQLCGAKRYEHSELRGRFHDALLPCSVNAVAKQLGAQPARKAARRLKTIAGRLVRELASLWPYPQNGFFGRRLLSRGPRCCDAALAASPASSLTRHCW